MGISILYQRPEFVWIKFGSLKEERVLNEDALASTLACTIHKKLMKYEAYYTH